MQLGAASNFSQGWSDRIWRAALDLPLPRLRDSIRWEQVERTPGLYVFDKPTTTWPDRFARSGTPITLTLNWGNPLYDDGKTPHSPQALAAFGRFAAAVVRRFPQIDTLEIGNEINGNNFVSGPVRNAGLARRGQYHLAMVRAAARAVHRVRPGIKVLGGSTHSLPAGFLWPLLDLSGAGAIEGLALHPYTTPIDQLPGQIGLLRRNGTLARLPLSITEFGSQDARHAADDLVRGYAVLAALGVSEMDWYPLNPRGDGMIPLVRRDGSLTDTGKAFRFVQARMAGLPARDDSPDPFTSIRRFGSKIAVIWGAPRRITVDPGNVSVFDATGARLDTRNLILHERRVLVLIGTRPLKTAQLVHLGCSRLLADSFHQFGYPLPGARQAAGDGFERYVRVGSHALPFEVMPGQQRRGVPWTPYLGRRGMRDLRLTADTILPAVEGGNGAVVHHYATGRDLRVHLLAEFSVSPRSTDGVAMTLSRNGHDVLTRSGNAPITVDLHLNLRRGQALSLSLAPGTSARGDITRYRIRILDESRCAENAPPNS
ncbi:hypothetical protein [Novosphingobium mangrovi (ex Huang et al. 2023)]|uniref:Asl1-like glycosyl hydrolase catalytic domain-containing protein n=1 Tax=Novosphingobium mangrovi (ex Huang et al. 2023) TaxID=2976432 RepID=A0ABT2I1N5_9SPHN|nr:hypothetical protein [Novosphingobium mangrovi (ex Huang et al. 2023)]MCT2398706.1 hypothetical protein [Novosphingobium mangrovi (ex Huang et al. 2023)]